MKQSIIDTVGLSELSINELKALLVARGIDYASCFEKSDLVQLLIDTNNNHKIANPVAADSSRIPLRILPTANSALSVIMRPSSHILNLPVDIIRIIIKYHPYLTKYSRYYYMKPKPLKKLKLDTSLGLGLPITFQEFTTYTPQYATPGRRVAGVHDVLEWDGEGLVWACADIDIKQDKTRILHTVYVSSTIWRRCGHRWGGWLKQLACEGKHVYDYCASPHYQYNYNILRNIRDIEYTNLFG